MSGAEWQSAFWIIILAAIFWIAAKFGRRTGSRTTASKDHLVLEELRRAGSDLGKPHPIDFYFYFPTREAAERTARELGAMGFPSTIPEATSSKWEVLSKKSLVPSETEILRLRSTFEVLAAKEGGEYDGWGSPIMR